MKTFDEIYDELQSTDNSELNDAWKQAKMESEKANKISLIACLIIDIFIIIMFLKNTMSISNTYVLMPMLMSIFIADIFAYVIINILFSKNKNQYHIKYKEIVIKKLMNNFYDNLEYFPNKQMPQYIYDNGNYNEYYNRYRSEDYLEGQINSKYGIQMAEVLTQKEETYRDSDGKTHTRIITRFHGLFGKIEMDKSINSKLRIMQNGAGRWGKNKLKMDSSEFEKYFDVEASDKIKGMQLLTADVMEELIEFENKTNMKYDVYINNNNLYLRFHCGDMFEPGNIKKGALDEKSIQKYFYMLNFTYNLSNKLITLINETDI